MTVIRYHIVVLLLLLLPLSCSGASVYRSVGDCKIALPESWVAVRDVFGIKACTMFTANPTAFPWNGIMIDPVRIPRVEETQDEEENEVLDGIMYSLSKSPGYTVLDRSDTSLGGVNGKSVTLRFGKKGYSKFVRICASAFIVHDRAYIIMCGCDDAAFTQNIPAFARALSTVRFTGN